MVQKGRFVHESDLVGIFTDLPVEEFHVELEDEFKRKVEVGELPECGKILFTGAGENMENVPQSDTPKSTFSFCFDDENSERAWFEIKYDEVEERDSGRVLLIVPSITYIQPDKKLLEQTVEYGETFFSIIEEIGNGSISKF